MGALLNSSRHLDSNRFFSQTKPTGDFLVRKTLYGMKRDYLPTAIRQGLDRFNCECNLLAMRNDCDHVAIGFARRGDAKIADRDIGKNAQFTVRLYSNVAGNSEKIGPGISNLSRGTGPNQSKVGLLYDVI